MSKIDLNKKVELRDPITGKRTIRQTRDLVAMRPMSPEEYGEYYHRVLRPLQEEHMNPDLMILLLDENPEVRKKVFQHFMARGLV